MQNNNEFYTIRPKYNKKDKKTGDWHKYTQYRFV